MADQEVGKTAGPAVPHPELPPELARTGVGRRMKNWVQDEGPWWLCSFVFHLVLVCSLALVSGRVVEKVVDDAPSFDEAKVDQQADVPQEIERFEVGETPEDPTELNADTLSLEKPAQIEERHTDSTPVFSEKTAVVTTSGQSSVGGLAGFDVKALGATGTGKGKVGAFTGTGISARGGGGEGWGFAGRTSSGSKKAMLGSSGGTRQSERAVAAALNWLARHQLPNGSWSLSAYKSRCKDGSCTGPSAPGDRFAAATALALLPYLAAGQTHESKGRYRQNIYAGISYLIKNQKPNGDLRLGGAMYDQGLASIALCECYGMSGDKMVGRAAQAALNFIMDAQDPAGGGWRYEPRQPGDTSVVGWQIMGLKSGMMAYLSVNPMVLEKAKVFLKAVSQGTKGKLGAGGRFGYAPGSAPTPVMSAVGLLCSEYLGAPRTDPAMIEGTTLLMQNQPDNGTRHTYYWYYATQVLHNQPGPDWDTWNRKMRRTLINWQCKDEKCEAGSWDPDKPIKDVLGEAGGRILMTSLSTLTLEVYYRYLPLYKLDKDDASEGGAPPAADQPVKKAGGKGETKAAGKTLAKPETKAAKKGVK